jgi:hypothetical protein
VELRARLEGKPAIGAEYPVPGNVAALRQPREDLAHEAGASSEAGLACDLPVGRNPARWNPADDTANPPGHQPDWPAETFPVRFIP